MAEINSADKHLKDCQVVWQQLKKKKSYEHLNKKMEKFPVRRRDAFHAQNGPMNFHENAPIHRFEMLITFSFLKIIFKKQTSVMSVNTDLIIMLFTVVASTMQGTYREVGNCLHPHDNR